jgi:hypothetical protein
MGGSSKKMEHLKRETQCLRDFRTCKSARVTWNTQTIQVQFEESQAIDCLTRKIKDAWGCRGSSIG